jgi:REP element-mobilizing transposase RayT
MPRPLRKCLPEVTYYCTSRCIELRNIFLTRFVKEIVINVINRTLQKYNFEVIHLDFDGNRFHLIMRTLENGETVSRIMQFIKSRIAMSYNRKMKRTGAFWNERFSSEIIEEKQNPEEYLRNLIWQISYYQVEKEIVSDPRDSKYGTIRFFIEENYIPRVKITLHKYYLSLGQSKKERIAQFLFYETSHRRGRPAS